MSIGVASGQVHRVAIGSQDLDLPIVPVVDDVIATGGSIGACLRLLRAAGAEVMAIGCLLTEADGWRPGLGDDAGLVHSLGSIPVFAPGDDGTWVPRTVPPPAGPT